MEKIDSELEKIDSELGESESKQRSLAKAYDSVRSQATSLIVFSVKWKDLEEHFESTRNSLSTRFRELETREREIGARETQLEAKEWSFHLEKESKAEDLRGLDNLLDKKLKEVIDTKNNLDSLMSLIREHSDEVLVQERRLTEVEGFVRERQSECDSVDRRIRERTKKLHWVEKSLEEKSNLVECKAEEVEGLREALDKYGEEIEVKAMKLHEILESTKAKEKELDLKEGLIKSLEECEKELVLKEEKLKAILKSLAECENTIESREKVMREIDLKEKDYELRKSLMEEWSCKLEFKARELELKEKQVEHLEELHKSIQDGEKHLDTMSKGLQRKERQLEEQAKELALKQKEFDLMKKSAEEQRKNLESKERQLLDQVNELELEQKEFDSVKKTIEKQSRILKAKERKLEVEAKELELKRKEIDSVKKSNEEHSENLKLKQRQIEDQATELEKETHSIQKSTEERTRILKAKERQLEAQAKELKLKQKDIDSRTKSNEEQTRIWKEKERQLEVQAKELELKQKHLKSEERQLEDQSKDFELKQKDFDSIKKSNEEQTRIWKEKERQLEVQAKELELKQKDIDSIKRSNEEHTRIWKEKERQLEVQVKELELKQKNLKSKERQLEDQSKEFELKQKDFDSVKISTEEYTRNLKAKGNTSILRSQVKIEQLEHIPSNNAVVPSSASNQSNNRDGRGLQLFMNEHLQRIDSVGSEISDVLEASSDPAKLVLDAMQGFYPSNSTVDKGVCDFDLRVIRKSCILLLEALKRVSPQVNPQVREEAMKVAGEWKTKMTTGSENWLEVLGFLRLVTVYEITSTYDTKELQSLIATIAECEQATELSQALGSTDKASASIICVPVKTEKPESSLVKDTATVSSPNRQLTATIDAMKLQGFLDELSRGNPLIKNETLAALQVSTDPAKFVLDVIQNSFDQYWGNKDVHYKETVMFSYINLLEQLMGVLSIVVHLKYNALNLAVQWKAKMGPDTQNPLELVGFLQFIVTYGMISSFARCEIVMLLGRISQHKQTRELCQTLTFADKIPAHFARKLIETKQLIEAVRLICTFKLINTFPPVPLLEKFVESTKDSARKICRKTKSVDEKDKVIDDEIAALRAAVQCIKDCNLESEYPSGNIEIQVVWLESIKEGRRRSSTSLACKVGQQEGKKSLACKVEQEEQTKSLASEVEQEKKKPRASNVEQQEQKKSLASNVKPQEQGDPPSKVGQQEPNKFEQQKQKKGNKRRRPQLQKQQQHHQQQNKFQRTSESAGRPYAAMPKSTPDHPHRSLSWTRDNYRYPVQQHGMAEANGYGIGANCGQAGKFGMYGNHYETCAIPNSGIHPPYQYSPSPPTYGSYQA